MQRGEQRGLGVGLPACLVPAAPRSEQETFWEGKKTAGRMGSGRGACPAARRRDATGGKGEKKIKIKIK